MIEPYVECEKGWEKLYGPLFQLCAILNIEVLQVKEKFGGLRFYVGGVPAEQFDMVHAFIDAVEAQSYTVCEECGIRNGASREGDKTYTRVKVTTEGGWVLTLCEQCRKERDDKRAAEAKAYKEQLARRQTEQVEG